MLFNYTPKEMELVFAVPWSSSKMNSFTVTTPMVLWISQKWTHN
jgi:hypothetical protein